jgi:peptide/nickel transport system ATP-binding protein
MADQQKPASTPLLQVEDLRMHFPVKRGLLQRTVGWVKAVDGVSLTIGRGEILGLVGESGSGKTTVGRAVMRAYRPTGGSVLFDPRPGQSAPVDLAGLARRELRSIWRDVQMVFQDPFSSLNPRMTLLQLIGEPLRNYGLADDGDLQDQVAELMRTVGLRPDYMARYPHAFSGGQRQRIVVARALAPRPKLIICDEPTSALDVSIQAQVLNLLLDLQEEFGLSYLFISHDLSVVEHLCDRIAVMYAGKLVESAETSQVFGRPRHPYTEALLSAVPVPDPRRRAERVVLTGDVPDPTDLPSGCSFAPRCGYATDRCSIDEPDLAEAADGHQVSCLRSSDLQLQPARG